MLFNWKGLGDISHKYDHGKTHVWDKLKKLVADCSESYAETVIIKELGPTYQQQKNV